jgi:hypothetical protein
MQISKSTVDTSVAGGSEIVMGCSNLNETTCGLIFLYSTFRSTATEPALNKA